MGRSLVLLAFASLASQPPESLRRVMRIFSSLTGFLTRWYVIASVMTGLGIAGGVLIFIYVFPGPPKIGVIDVPYTVINDNSASMISEYLNYARQDDSIKAVVLKLSTPGGGAAASERLYIETRKLREEKPVVIVMNGLVASGGYMMSMGASHTFAQTSSLVGNVGVVAFAGPLIAPFPSEEVVVTGPYKRAGSTRREWIGSVDFLKSAFAKMVVFERGDRLLISEDELVQGRIYMGLEAERLGLVDEIGGDSDAFEKAADLAGISNYGLVDVNLAVLKKNVRDMRKVYQTEAEDSDSSAIAAALHRDYTAGQTAPDSEPLDDASSQMEVLQRLTLYGMLGIEQENPLPEFPLDISSGPHFYYLYIGNDP